MRSPEAIVLDLFGTLVFFDQARVPMGEIGGRRVPMTVTDLPERLARVLPSVALVDFHAALARAGAALVERKRREGVEIHTSVRFETALVELGADAAVAADAARAMAVAHMDSLARAVVCPPGRRDLLRGLAAKSRLALLSNFDDTATARRVLGEAGIDDCFDVVVISDEVGLRKPTPAIFEDTCARLGVAASSCLHVGDTLVEDIHGASGAGLAAVWIHPDPRAESPALAVLRDVDELPAWLDGGGFSARSAASR